MREHQELFTRSIELRAQVRELQDEVERLEDIIEQNSDREKEHSSSNNERDETTPDVVQKSFDRDEDDSSSKKEQDGTRSSELKLDTSKTHLETTTRMIDHLNEVTAGHLEAEKQISRLVREALKKGAEGNKPINLLDEVTEVLTLNERLYGQIHRYREQQRNPPTNNERGQ